MRTRRQLVWKLWKMAEHDEDWVAMAHYEDLLTKYREPVEGLN
jgi:hypothetical protein